MDDDLKAKLTLEAQATGGDELRAMAEQVRAMGQDAGASAPKLNALAAVLDHVADQQQLIDSFKAGKRAVAELEAQMGAAATQVEQLAAEQERAAQAAAAAAAAQANGARQLEAARAAQQGYKDAIAAARAELAQLRDAGKAGMTPELAAQTKAAAEQLKVLQGEARKSGEQVKLLAAEQKTSAQASREAAAAQQQAGAAYDRGVKAAGQISAALGEQRRALDGTRDALRGAGVDSDKLAQAQAGVNARAAEAREKFGGLQKLYQGVSESARQTRASVAGIGDSAGAADKTAAAAQRMGGSMMVAGDAAKRLGGMLATAFTARELVAAAADMEKLRAGLQAVTGDAQSAAREMDFVRGIASRAGVDVAEAAKAYLGLAAATKGTAVEGQATREVFEAVSVSMARAGKSSAETSQALVALQQMAGKGVVSMEEMRQQLGEALPGAFQAAANGMGITTQELNKLIESGQVTAQDLFPALTKGLQELYGSAPQAQTLAQEFANIKNAFVDMADNIGQAGGSNALKAFAEGAQAALVFLDASLVATGQKIGVLMGAVSTLDFSGVKDAFAQIESEAQTKLAKAAQHNELLRASLQAVGGEATQAALAMQQAGAAAQQGAAQADASAVSYQALGAAYKKVRDELAQQIDLSERDVKAAKARGDAAVAQARLLGDEAALRAAIGQAAQGEAQALATLAQQRQTEVDVLRAELDNKKALLATAGTLSEERTKELQALEALVAQKHIDADATAAQAAAAQASARAKGPEAQAAEQVRVAAQASAVARKSEADAAINLLAHQRGLAQQSEQMARLMGDETSARRERIRQMEIDAQITRAKAEVQRVEAEGSIAVARATLAEMAAKGEANAVKQAELQASIKLAEAKLKEVELLKQAASAAEFAIARQRDLGEVSASAGKKAADGAKQAANAAEEAGKKHEQVGKTIQFTWVSAAAAASRYKDEAIAHANALEGKWQSLSALGSAPMSWGMYFEAWNNHFDTLTRLADEYVATMEALDRQQQAIERTNIGAARSVDALKLRLIELNGTEEQAAAARRERDEAEVRRQIKLAEIEAARAAARNDEGEIARYREEIALLGEQLTLLGKVYAAEQKQRAVKARGDEGGSGGGGGGVSAGPATMNVTLNANGISDPVKLARMIEPELARLQRLAR